MTNQTALTIRDTLPEMQLDVAEVTRIYVALTKLRTNVLKQGVDYDVIPGTGKKPTLLQPGAQKVCMLFGVHPEYDILKQEEDWTGENHGGEPFFHYEIKCRLVHSSGVKFAESHGECNSWEEKYRYRWVYENQIPADVDKTTLRKNKYNKYQVKNIDVYSIVNTLLKMAQKRALVGAASGLGVSDFFTQDVEDFADREEYNERRQPQYNHEQPEPPTPSSPAMSWRPELINAIATLGSIDTKTASNGLYLRNVEGAFTDAELEDEWAILDKVEEWMLQKDIKVFQVFYEQEREPLPPCVVRNLLGELTLAHSYNGKANKEERANLQETYNFYIDAGKTLHDLTHWLFDCSLDNISKNQKEALETWLTFTDQEDGSVLTSTVAEQELNAVLTHLEELDSLTDAVGPRQ